MSPDQYVIYETDVEVSGQTVHVALTVSEAALESAAGLPGVPVDGTVQYHAVSLAKPRS